MFRKSPIRTKMIAVFGLFLAIVGALAFSGFWGLYRYRSLANAVSRRASEMPYAYDLYRWAETLRDSNNRINALSLPSGMIEASLLQESAALKEFEEHAHDQALIAFNLTLQRYETMVGAATRDQSMLVDTARQLESLEEIRDAIGELDSFHRKPFEESARRQALKNRYNAIVDQTSEHLALINNSMIAFSDDVAGQYRTWIAVAWSCIAGAVVLVTILTMVLRSHVVKPFRTLLVGSRLVAKGQFGHRIDLGTGDELSELAEAMNQMSDRFERAYEAERKLNAALDQQVKDRTREVIQNEQLASVGFLAAGVAHEINNPLATIAWSAESLESRVEELDDDDTSEVISVDRSFVEAIRINLRRIQDEAYRCKGITERLLDFSRLGDVRRTSTNLRELIDEVVSMVSNVGKYRCKTLTTHGDADVFAHVNSHEIRQVVLNLITNALESVDSDGEVQVHVRRQGRHAYVGVFDNGCGMSQEVLDHLFEPFFTRRRDGTGTGLGLSITYRIVSQHHGSLMAHSDGEGCGSRMEMLLPVQPEENDLPVAIPHSTQWNHETERAA